MYFYMLMVLSTSFHAELQGGIAGPPYLDNHYIVDISNVCISTLNVNCGIQYTVCNLHYIHFAILSRKCNYANLKTHNT